MLGLAERDIWILREIKVGYMESPRTTRDKLLNTIVKLYIDLKIDILKLRRIISLPRSIAASDRR